MRYFIIDAMNGHRWERITEEECGGSWDPQEISESAEQYTIVIDGISLDCIFHDDGIVLRTEANIEPDWLNVNNEKIAVPNPVEG